MTYSVFSKLLGLGFFLLATACLVEPRSSHRQCTTGALIIRIGFWGPLYYTYNNYIRDRLARPVLNGNWRVGSNSLFASWAGCHVSSPEYQPGISDLQPYIMRQWLDGASEPGEAMAGCCRVQAFTTLRHFSEVGGLEKRVHGLTISFQWLLLPLDMLLEFELVA